MTRQASAHSVDAVLTDLARCGAGPVDLHADRPHTMHLAPGQGLRQIALNRARRAVPAPPVTNGPSGVHPGRWPAPQHHLCVSSTALTSRSGARAAPSAGSGTRDTSTR